MASKLAIDIPVNLTDRFGQSILPGDRVAIASNYWVGIGTVEAVYVIALHSKWRKPGTVNSMGAIKITVQIEQPSNEPVTQTYRLHDVSLYDTQTQALRTNIDTKTYQVLSLMPHQYGPVLPEGLQR